MDAHSQAPAKNNTLNTIGIVTVGVVGSVFVYVSIVALQALYVAETSTIATQKSFGTQGEVKSSLRAEQIGNITDPRARPAEPGKTPLYSIGIDAAKQLIVRDAVSDPSRLVPAVGSSTKPTIAPAFGRPQPLPAAGAPPATEPAAGDPATGTDPAAPGGDPAAAPGADPAAAPGAAQPEAPAGGPSGSPATGTGGAGAGSGDPAGSVAPAASAPPAAPATPTASGTDRAPTGGTAPTGGR